LNLHQSFVCLKEKKIFTGSLVYKLECKSIQIEELNNDKPTGKELANTDQLEVVP